MKKIKYNNYLDFKVLYIDLKANIIFIEIFF